ncbi:MAG: hypothetical protein LBS50_07265 [Prevotellaceae bacterium]|jgi:hypothetical protein|nr:hypothetical protein [Prevotellaceae bacterium]
MAEIYNLQQIGENLWQAQYHGNYGNYSIKLTLDKQCKVTKYSCSCPSDYSPCKHIGFVQEEIKNKMLNFENKNTANEISIKDVLQNVSLDELRDFVIDKAKYNNDLAQAIMLKFAEKTTSAKNENNGNNYSQMIRKGLAKIEVEPDESYYDYDYDDFYVDLDILGEWLKKAKKLADNKQYSDAEQICKAAIEEYVDWFEKNSSDSEYDFDYCIEDDYQKGFADLLGYMAKNGNIDKKSLYEWCKIEIAKKKYANMEVFDYLNNLMSDLANDVNPADFIASQEKLFKSIKDKSSSEAKTVLERLIKFYNANNQQDKAEKIIENNIQIDSFCQITIEKHIANKRYAEAKKMLNEKLKNCGTWAYNQWNELLLIVAQKENDLPEIRRITLEFLKYQFDNEHFRIYKSAFSENNWQDAFEKLYKHYNTPKNQCNDVFNHNVANLLKAEKLDERLLEYCETHCGINNWQQYYTLFAAQFPKRTLALFNKLLDLYAEKNLGRDKYEYVVQILKLMQRITGGKQVVQQMTDNYRTLYKNRRAMMEVIKKGNV